ncbi:hypothetical protein BLOT_016143 [Blomia tropicalis]|nr:hypothetical protein BLOT_016143 [Blomia tropicalis]
MNNYLNVITYISLLYMIVLRTRFVQGGILDYNLMGCMDFVRHMGGTVPSRFGLFGSSGVARRQESVAPAAEVAAESGAIAAAAGAGAQQSSSGTIQDLLTSLANGGTCASAPPSPYCVSIDSFLERNFPQWFFEYQVTNNVNHVVGQLTQHRYHALFEASLKAYKCFCQC